MMGPILWNQLPNFLKQSTTVNQFRETLRPIYSHMNMVTCKLNEITVHLSISDAHIFMYIILSYIS